MHHLIIQVNGVSVCVSISSDDPQAQQAACQHIATMYDNDPNPDNGVIAWPSDVEVLK